MRLQIVLAMTVVCGMVSVGCSDGETSGSGGGGLDCDSSYSMPTSLEQLTVRAFVAEGNGDLCDVLGVITTLVFGPDEFLAANQFGMTTPPPPQTCACNSPPPHTHQALSGADFRYAGGGGGDLQKQPW